MKRTRLVKKNKDANVFISRQSQIFLCDVSLLEIPSPNWNLTWRLNKYFFRDGKVIKKGETKVPGDRTLKIFRTPIISSSVFSVTLTTFSQKIFWSKSFFSPRRYLTNFVLEMDSLRSKRKFAGKNRKIHEESWSSNQSRDSTFATIQEDYITQVSEEIEGGWQRDCLRTSVGQKLAFWALCRS